MLSGPSLLPVRPGRTFSSGLPRPAGPSTTSKAPPPPVLVAVEEHPVASTSKLPPPPSTPARSEYEASRLDWADLLAEKSEVDLLNDESATWLLDRSAFTIGARTPAKALATSGHRHSLAVGTEGKVEEDSRPLAQDVVQPLRGTSKAASYRIRSCADSLLSRDNRRLCRGRRRSAGEGSTRRPANPSFEPSSAPAIRDARRATVCPNQDKEPFAG